MEKFEKLKKEFGLPSFEELAERFELSVKADEEPTLQAVRNEITERLYDAAKTIESMIFPREGGDPDILYIEKMIENLTDDCHTLYKDLNHLYTRGVRLKFEHNRKEDAEFIKTVFDVWPKFEAKLKILFKTIEEGWKKTDLNSEVNEEVYHG
ncbi:MAG: hypothetical protein HY512_03775 [Candidatus Aenigmarchaeota archaeon]|nr:hypothetical protein [Candidatus Aenigmarchaeota archaeon]